MTVAVQQVYNSYTGDGVATQFAYKFLVYEQGDIVAEVDGKAVTPANITGIGSSLGGNVIFSTPPAKGARVVIRRAMPLSRATDYQENGDWIASTINRDFDRLWMALQDFTANTSTSLAHPLGGLDYDAQGHRIYGLADPKDDNDAVNKNYVDTIFTDTAAAVLQQAGNSARAAAQSASDAAAAAGGITQSVTAAATSARDAAADRQQVGTWRTEIETWHTDVSGWHTAMAGWVDAAKQQATNAAASAKTASDAIAPIKAQAEAAAQSASDAAGSANTAAQSASTAQQHRSAAAQSAQSAADKLADVQKLATSFDVSKLLNVADFPLDFAKGLVKYLTFAATGIKLKSDLDADNNKLINVKTPTANTDAATKGYVDNTVSNLTIDTSNLVTLDDPQTIKGGKTFTGTVEFDFIAKTKTGASVQFDTARTVSVPEPINDYSAATKKYVDEKTAGVLTADADASINGNLTINKIITAAQGSFFALDKGFVTVSKPLSKNSAVNKGYVDDAIAGAGGGAGLDAEHTPLDLNAFKFTKGATQSYIREAKDITNGPYAKAPAGLMYIENYGYDDYWGIQFATAVGIQSNERWGRTCEAQDTWNAWTLVTSK
ncbi:hypothetical protein BEE12_16115 [Pantoea agglomerans]|uniref:phage tail fiber domain-containing protein n=1 Tax=Enterobacter agglomerans TaxID=549 RepID=UPI00083DED43|nr:phage tail fiber protein [Pantoea agglomerans]AOE41242.1 hypothetical protein BEE12_16115 [Pantoea agglomerans]